MAGFAAPDGHEAFGFVDIATPLRVTAGCAACRLVRRFVVVEGAVSTFFATQCLPYAFQKGMDGRWFAEMVMKEWKSNELV